MIWCLGRREPSCTTRSLSTDGHPVWTIAFAPDVIVLLHNSSGTPPEDNSGLWSSLDSASNAASQFPILAGGLDEAIDVNEMIVHGADCLEQTG